MAKTITWKNDDNELCVLNIADGSSDETTFLPAAEPFMTAMQESDDLFTPIRTSSGYIRIVVDSVDDIAALVGSSPLNRAVTLTTSNASGSSSTIKWKGFLSCESFTQTWDKGPIEIELPVISPLGVLQGIYPSDEINHLGYVNFAQFLLNMNAALGSPFTYFFFPVLSEAATTLQYQFTMQNYASAIDKNTGHEVASYYEILEDICKLFGWQCIEYGNYLVFLAADVKKLEEGNTNNYQGYTVQRMTEIANGGTSVTVSNKPSFTAVIPIIGGADHSQTWIAGKKSVEVTGEMNERSETIWSMDILEQCTYMGSDKVQTTGTTSFHYLVKEYGAYKREGAVAAVGNIKAFNTEYATGQDADVEGNNIKFDNYKASAALYMGGSVGYEKTYWMNDSHDVTSGSDEWIKRLIFRHDGTHASQNFQAFILSTNFFYTPTQNRINNGIIIKGQLLYAATAQDIFAKATGTRYTKASLRVVGESGTYYWSPDSGWYNAYSDFLIRSKDGEITDFGYVSSPRLTFYASIPAPAYSGELQLILYASTTAGNQSWPGTSYIAYENLSIQIIPIEGTRGAITIEEEEQRADENQKKVNMNNGFTEAWSQDCGLTLARENVPDSYGVVLAKDKTLPSALYDGKWTENALATRVADYYSRARQKLKVIVKQGASAGYKGALLSPMRAYQFVANGQSYICVEQQMNWKTNEITAGFFEPSFMN